VLSLHLSFQRKLTLLVLTVTAVALAMLCLALALYERHTFRNARRNELTLLANTLGANTAASMAFNDQRTATDILSALQTDPNITTARLYDTHCRVFAEYSRVVLPPGHFVPPLPNDGAVFDPGSLTLTLPVSLNGERYGSIVLTSDLRLLRRKLGEYVQIVVFVLVITLICAYFASSRPLRAAIEPILELAKIAEKISFEDNYSLRARPGAKDETGTLIRSFNDMLDGIQQRDSALLTAKDGLEDRVRARTEALRLEVEQRTRVEEALSHVKQLLPPRQCRHCQCHRH
jgi:methyl-accepting chemotaxis protein